MRAGVEVLPWRNGRRSPGWVSGVLGVIVLTGLGQAIPCNTDWLWYSEVGSDAGLHTRVLSLRGWLSSGRAPPSSLCTVTSGLRPALRRRNVLWELAIS